jgi:hypothetical protein
MPNGQFFSYNHGENQLNFDEMMMIKSALHWTNMLSWIFKVLADLNSSLLVDMSLYLDTIFWFWANQALLLLLSSVFLVKKQKYQFIDILIVFALTPPELEPTVYHTWEENAITLEKRTLIIITITPLMWLIIICLVCVVIVKNMWLS